MGGFLRRNTWKIYLGSSNNVFLIQKDLEEQHGEKRTIRDIYKFQVTFTKVKLNRILVETRGRSEKNKMHRQSAIEQNKGIRCYENIGTLNI